ncbi:MAG: alpha/beta hydrolase, partial [Geminicoccaceae bacterium]
IQAYIKLANELFEDDADASIDEQRQAYLELCNAFARPHPEGVKALDRTMKASGIEIPLRIYRPAASGALPAVLFFHGGGWVLGDLDSHDSIAADLCGRTGAVVIAVHYRLAPEHHFPAAFDDCFAALSHVTAHAADFGIDPARIIVCGDSAGGNLAAAVALAARDRNGPALAGQVLIYPACGNDFDLPSCYENARAPMFTRDDLQDYWKHYLGADRQRASCYAVPMLAPHFRELPPAFVTTAQYDPVRDDGRQYAECLRNAGIRVELRNAPRLIHGWLRARAVSDDAKTEFKAICKAIRRMLQIVPTPTRA